MWTDDVVPIAVECVALDVQFAHLLLRHLLAGRIFSLIERGVNDETCTCRCVSNEAHDDLEGAQRFAPPVHRDEGEHAMLDLVPLARARREVPDMDGEIEPVGKVLKLRLPRARSVAVASIPCCVNISAE